VVEYLLADWQIELLKELKEHYARIFEEGTDVHCCTDSCGCSDLYRDIPG